MNQKTRIHGNDSVVSESRNPVRPYVRPSVTVSRSHSIVLDGTISATSETFMQAAGPAKKSA